MPFFLNGTFFSIYLQIGEIIGPKIKLNTLFSFMFRYIVSNYYIQNY